MTQISKNFTLEEMYASSTAKAHGIGNVPTDRVKQNLTLLVEKILQPLRDEFGETIIVTSGYRSPSVNKLVKGASNSDHMYGCASDIRTKSDKPADNKRLFDLAVKMMKEKKLKDVKQIIDEYNYNWVHISFQDGRSTKRNQVLHLK